jgi:hypothetical protein
MVTWETAFITTTSAPTVKNWSEIRRNILNAVCLRSMSQSTIQPSCPIRQYIHKDLLDFTQGSVQGIYRLAFNFIKFIYVILEMWAPRQSKQKPKVADANLQRLWKKL